MEEEFKNNYLALKNRIWKTYKSRVNTAERLKQKDSFLAFLSVYYSAVLAAVSILNYANKSEKMDIFSIVLSIIVTILFLHFEGRNYKERYVKMKENYNKLNHLYYKVENSLVQKDLKEDDFSDQTDEYLELLNAVENHNERDYIKYGLKDSEIRISVGDTLKYYLYAIIIWLIKFLLFIFPTIVLIIALYQLII